MKKTYIFFEPLDETFFEGIVSIYNGLIRKYYKDAAKSHSAGKSAEFFKNYEKMIFPGCDYNSNPGFHCPQTICSKEKWPGLTENQRALVLESIHGTINSLYSDLNRNDVVIEKIKSGLRKIHEVNDNGIKKTLLFKRDNTLPHYWQAVRGADGIEDAKKLVFVSTNNGNYENGRDNLLKTKNLTLHECTCYQ